MKRRERGKREQRTAFLALSPNKFAKLATILSAFSSCTGLSASPSAPKMRADAARMALPNWSVGRRLSFGQAWAMVERACWSRAVDIGAGEEGGVPGFSGRSGGSRGGGRGGAGESVGGRGYERGGSTELRR